MSEPSAERVRGGRYRDPAFQHHWGLRGRLLLLVALALLPAMALLVVKGLDQRRQKIAELHDRALNLARLVAQAQEHRVEGARQLLMALSRTSEVRSGNIETCTQYVRALVSDYAGLYTEIGWADIKGLAVCHARAAPADISIADRPYFQRAMRTGAFAVGDLMYGRLSGAPALAFAYPLRTADGTIEGVAFANLDLRTLTRSLQANAPEPTTTVSILDQNGTLLARSVEGERYIGTKASAAQLRVMIERRELVTEFEGPDKVRRVYAIATARDHAGTPAFFVVIGTPRDVLMAAADTRLRFDLLTIALFGAGVLAAAWIGADLLVRRPVHRLVAATQALATGRLETRAEDVGGISELEALGGAFNRMAEQLERRESQLRQAQRLEAIGQLAGGIAHDFNNLLTVILGYSESLRETVARGSAAEAELSELRTAAERAARLTQQLLAFSRRQMLQPKPMLLNDVVTPMETLLQRTLGGDITLVTTLAADLDAVRADAAQIEQVILNLVINARDAMPGGGTVTVETFNVPAIPVDQIVVADHDVPPAGPWIGLSVADTGTGMDEATRSRMFEPFFTTKGASGTGLGLATVYGIVKQSGGFVGCDSVPGAGTRFTMWLPRTSTPVDDRARPAIEPPAGGSESVVIVDDEDSIRFLIRRTLVKHGYRVRDTGQPSEALEWLRDDDAVDLLITDVKMPGMNGPTLYREAAAHRPDLKVLFISGFTDPEVAATHGPATMPFLQKPFTPLRLLEKIRELLDDRPTASAGGRLREPTSA